MCGHFSQSKTRIDLSDHFNLVYDSDLPVQARYNAFTHPEVPIIIRGQEDRLTMASWGLLPAWAKEKSFQKNTINARAETLAEKASFKNYLSNRCLIPADSFYEWQWLDEKGREKQKYEIYKKDKALFAFAGLFSRWQNQLTFTIITTVADAMMAEIHNTKKRMPVILNPEEEKLWMTGKRLEKIRDQHLEAEKVT